MSKVSVYDIKGNVVADTELNDEIWGVEPNVPVMHAVVVNYLANQRQGTQSALTRTEVSGGGKKPGDRRAPVMQDRALQDLLSGCTAVSPWAPSPAATDSQ